MKKLNNLFFYNILIILSSSLIIKNVSCDKWEYQLVHNLLNGYDSSIRPSIHHNSTLNVTFGLALVQIIDIDERNMIVTTHCWLNQGWLDPKLTWDPKMYDGLKSIHIPSEKIWKPDIILTNNADSLARLSSISTNVIVYYNGNVTWMSTVIFKSSCSINVQYFPFDQQNCLMVFASWTFNGFLLDLFVNSNDGDLTNYIKNGEWDLINLTVERKSTVYSCCTEPYPEIYYKLVLRRKPLFYVFNMVFPCLLITLVAFLGFNLPPGSSEKVNIGITTLLSITMFLMLITEIMPPTSEQLPLLGIYYAVTTCIVSLSTAMTVFTLNLHNKGRRGVEVPKLARKIFLNHVARIFKMKIYSNNHQINAKIFNEDSSSSNDFQQKNAQVEIENENLVHSVNFNLETNIGKSETNELLTVIKEIETRNPSKTNSFDSLFNNKSKNVLRNSLLTESSNKSSSSIQSHSCRILVNPSSSSNNFQNILNSSVHHISCICNCSNPSQSHSHSLNRIHNIQSKKLKLPVKTLPEKDRKIFKLCEELNENSDFKINSDDNQNSESITNKNECSDFYYSKNPLVQPDYLDITIKRNFGEIIDALKNTIKQGESRLIEVERREIIQNEWSDIAMILDRILCVIFTISTLLTCLIIFLNSPYTFASF